MSLWLLSSIPRYYCIVLHSQVYALLLALASQLRPPLQPTQQLGACVSCYACAGVSTSAGSSESGIEEALRAVANHLGEQSRLQARLAALAEAERSRNATIYETLIQIKQQMGGRLTKWTLTRAQRSMPQLPRVAVMPTWMTTVQNCSEAPMLQGLHLRCWHLQMMYNPGCRWRPHRGRWRMPTIVEAQGLPNNNLCLMMDGDSGLRPLCGKNLKLLTFAGAAMPEEAEVHQYT